MALPNQSILPGTSKVIVPISTSNISIAPANNITIDMALPKRSLNSRETTLTLTKGISIALSEKSKSLINTSQGRIYANKGTRGEKEIPINPYLLELDQNPDKNIDEVN